MERESGDGRDEESVLGRADGVPSRAAGWDRLYDAGLDEMTGLLREQARAWGRRLRLLQRLEDLSSLGAKAGVAQFPQLEMAGSWHVSQITATRWRDEAVRFGEALPRALAMLEAGELLEHQAKVLLHRTAHCSVEVARAVEAVVLPDGAGLCPADLAVRVDRAVLRIESERAELVEAERRAASVVAQRRTFGKALPDGMGMAGAVLTAEQLVGWQAGMQALERRERLADRAAGVQRTAEQRKADLFAALPSMVLAGTAQDRAAVAAALAAAGVVATTGAGGPAGGPAAVATVASATDGTPLTTAPAAGPAQSGTSASAGVSGGASAGVDRPAQDGEVVRPGCPAGAACPSAGAASSADSTADAGVVWRPWTWGPEQLAGQVVLNVLVPVSTVLELGREPAVLERYGPVSAEHVRLLRPRSWRRVMVDAGTGRPIALDDRTTPVDPDPAVAREQVRAMLTPDVVVDAEERPHDPSARLARLVDVRDVRCCGPGCASTRTHRDHLEPYPQGPTSARNLGRVSARCHRAKHAGWRLERHDDGSVTWTSPLGRVYTRPCPHAPPPQLDLHAEPPPLRARPVVDARPDSADTRSDEDLATEPDLVEDDDPEDSPDEDDDPPPF